MYPIVPNTPISARSSLIIYLLLNVLIELLTQFLQFKKKKKSENLISIRELDSIELEEFQTA